MWPRSVLSSALVLGVLALAGAAMAQQQGTLDATPPPADVGGSDPAAGAPEKKPSSPAAGYAYADKPTVSSRPSRARYRKSGPVVNMPGFEQTADGGSRLFVQLSQNVPVEERKAQGSITYVLKGASPRVWNNTNALVTVHFNTPVARARLVPHGQDLLFVIDLRAAVDPVWKMTEAEDKTALLSIDFPKGDYLQAGGAAAGAEPAAAQPRSKTARGKRAGRKAAPPVKNEAAPTP